MGDTNGRSTGRRNIAEQHVFPPVSNHSNGMVVPHSLCDYALCS